MHSKNRNFLRYYFRLSEKRVQNTEFKKTFLTKLFFNFVKYQLDLSWDLSLKLRLN